MTTPIDFAKALLRALALPETDPNVQALVAAQCIEGGFMHNGALFNPLNTTQKAPGSHAVTTIGVQAYPDWATGLEATRKTLANGLYAEVLSELGKSAPPDETLRAMSLSPWGWYHLENGKRVPNPIGHAAGYQSYGAHAFPETVPPSYLPGFVPSTDAEQSAAAETDETPPAPVTLESACDGPEEDE